MIRLKRLMVPAILCVMVLSLFLAQKYHSGQAMNAEMKRDMPSTKEVTPNKITEATVGVNRLNVRSQPSLSGTVVGKLDMGTKITVNDEQSGWTKIESSSGVQGWVFTNYILKDTTEPSNGGSLKGKTIVLDPGHGGNDDGTTSIVGTREKTLTLATAKAVAQKLENAGAIVYMTRTKDAYIPLLQRAELADQNHADAFISFHYNWLNDPSINGLTDFYYQKSKDNALAVDILHEVARTTGLHNDGTKFDDLDVLRNNSRPCTLIELGFLSNKQDDSVVESHAYFDKVAQGVYLGLLDYFSVKKHEIG